MVIPLHDDNPTTTRPYVTAGILIACVLAYVWQHLLLSRIGAQQAMYAFGLVPAVLTGREMLPPGIAVIPPGRPSSRPCSCTAASGTWRATCSSCGSSGTTSKTPWATRASSSFMSLCGIVAAFSQVLPNPGSVIPIVGASGAISGVLGAYMLLYPRARVLLGLPLGFVNRGVWTIPGNLGAGDMVRIATPDRWHRGRAVRRRIPGRHRLRRAHRRVHRRSARSSQFSNVATFRCGGVTETLLHSAHVARPEINGAHRGELIGRAV